MHGLEFPHSNGPSHRQSPAEVATSSIKNGGKA